MTDFSRQSGGSASLAALWHIVGKDGKETLVSRKSSFSEPARAPGDEVLTVVMNRTVAVLRREIAVALSGLSQRGLRH